MTLLIPLFAMPGRAMADNAVFCIAATHVAVENSGDCVTAKVPAGGSTAGVNGEACLDLDLCLPGDVLNQSLTATTPLRVPAEPLLFVLPDLSRLQTRRSDARLSFPPPFLDPLRCDILLT